MNITCKQTLWFNWMFALLLLLTLGAGRALAAEMKLEAHLIWGTNDEKSPDPSHKRVGPRIQKRLSLLPFKWKNYFEVNRRQFSVDKDGSKKLSLSKDCEVEVHNLGDNLLEVSLFGKGKLVGKIKQPLPANEVMVLGGNAENTTAWFVVLRQVD